MHCRKDCPVKLQCPNCETKVSMATELKKHMVTCKAEDRGAAGGGEVQGGEGMEVQRRGGEGGEVQGGEGMEVQMRGGEGGEVQGGEGMEVQWRGGEGGEVQGRGGETVKEDEEKEVQGRGKETVQGGGGEEVQGGGGTEVQEVEGLASLQALLARDIRQPSPFVPIKKCYLTGINANLCTCFNCLRH